MTDRNKLLAVQLALVVGVCFFFFFFGLGAFGLTGAAMWRRERLAVAQWSGPDIARERLEALAVKQELSALTVASLLTAELARRITGRTPMSLDVLRTLYDRCAAATDHGPTGGSGRLLYRPPAAPHADGC